MEIKTEEVFHNGDAPFNRVHAAVGVYQNTGQGHPENFSHFALMAVFRANVMKFRISIAVVQKPSSMRNDCINVGSGIMNYVFVDQCKSLCLWWRMCIK